MFMDKIELPMRILLFQRTKITLLKKFLITFLSVSLILPHSFINANGISSTLKYSLDIDGTEFQIPWHMETGKVSHMEVDKQSKSLTITLVRFQMKEDSLLIKLPIRLVTGDKGGTGFTITVNDKEIPYKEILRTNQVLELAIPLSSDATEVQLFAAHAASEFQLSEMLVSFAASISTIIMLLVRSKFAELDTITS